MKRRVLVALSFIRGRRFECCVCDLVFVWFVVVGIYAVVSGFAELMGWL